MDYKGVMALITSASSHGCLSSLDCAARMARSSHTLGGRPRGIPSTKYVRHAKPTARCSEGTSSMSCPLTRSVGDPGNLRSIAYS